MMSIDIYNNDAKTAAAGCARFESRYDTNRRSIPIISRARLPVTFSSRCRRRPNASSARLDSGVGSETAAAAASCFSRVTDRRRNDDSINNNNREDRVGKPFRSIAGVVVVVASVRMLIMSGIPTQRARKRVTNENARGMRFY